MIVVLAGGVGAARFLQGVVQVIPQDQLVVIANTGDDREFYGLHVSPDVDIVMYTLAGIVDEKNGWGIRDDTIDELWKRRLVCARRSRHCDTYPSHKLVTARKDLQ